MPCQHQKKSCQKHDHYKESHRCKCPSKKSQTSCRTKKSGCCLRFCSQANIISSESEETIVQPIVQPNAPISFPIAVAKAKGMKVVDGSSFYMHSGPVRIRVVLNPIKTVSDQDIVIELQLDGESIPLTGDPNQIFSWIVEEESYEMETMVCLPHSGYLRVVNTSTTPIALGKIANSDSVALDGARYYSTGYFEAFQGMTC